MKTRGWVVLLLGAALAQPALAQPAKPALPDPPAVDDVLTAETAVAWALQHNPELAVARKQRGIAEANVVIARTYPFNPMFQTLTMGVNGHDVTNHVFTENLIRIELELRGQRKIRKDAASAAMSRVEWEIAAYELNVAVRTLRAFNAFVYRQDKVRLLEDTIKLQEQTVQKVKLLSDQGKLKPADVMLAGSDLVEAKAQRGPAHALLVAAWNDLRRVLGTDREISSFKGRLEADTSIEDAEELTRQALANRPEIHAFEHAVVEADQRARLEVANRFGNPAIGPAMEDNETRTWFVGVSLQYPLPLVNRKKGEIMLRVAERDKLFADKRRVEIQATLDVKAALARLGEAHKWAKYFGSESLPVLQKTMEDFGKLFDAAEPSVDMLRLIDARRRLLRARDGYLDALWELSQARADLAAAVGDIEIALPAREALPQPQPAANNGRPHLLPPVAQGH